MTCAKWIVWNLSPSLYKVAWAGLLLAYLGANLGLLKSGRRPLDTLVTRIHQTLELRFFHSFIVYVPANRFAGPLNRSVDVDP